jgi:hypothetical protein
LSATDQNLDVADRTEQFMRAFEEPQRLHWKAFAMAGFRHQLIEAIKVVDT